MSIEQKNLIPLTNSDPDYFRSRVVRIANGDNELRARPQRACPKEVVRITKDLLHFRSTVRARLGAQNCPDTAIVMLHVANEITGRSQLDDETIQVMKGALTAYCALAEDADDLADKGNRRFSDVFNQNCGVNGSPREKFTLGLGQISRVSDERIRLANAVSNAGSEYIECEDRLQALVGDGKNIARPFSFLAEVLDLRNRGFGGLGCRLVEAVGGADLSEKQENELRSAILDTTISDAKIDCEEDGGGSFVKALRKFEINLGCPRDIHLRRVQTALAAGYDPSLRSSLNIVYHASLLKEKLERR